jgi:hypothetical protein
MEPRSRTEARGVCKAWRRQLSAAVERLNVQPQFLGTAGGGAGPSQRSQQAGGGAGPSPRSQQAGGSAGPSSRSQQAGGSAGAGISAAALLSAFPAASDVRIALNLGDIPAKGAQLASLVRALGEKGGGTLTALEIEAQDVHELRGEEDASAQRYGAAAFRQLLSRAALAPLARLEKLSLAAWCGTGTKRTNFAISENLQHLASLPGLTHLKIIGAAVDRRNVGPFCASLAAVTQLRSLEMTLELQLKAPAFDHARLPPLDELVALSRLASLRRLRLALWGRDLDDDTAVALAPSVQRLVSSLTALTELDVLQVPELRLVLPPGLAARLVALRAFMVGGVEDEPPQGSPVLTLALPALRKLMLAHLCMGHEAEDGPRRELRTPQLTSLTLSDLCYESLEPALEWLKRQTQLRELEARARPPAAAAAAGCRRSPLAAALAARAAAGATATRAKL